MSKRYHSNEERQDNKRRRNEGPPPEMYTVFQGEIASVKEYGVFVKIPGNSRQGLVHKSQISQSRVDDPSEMFAKGEVVYCKVISIQEDGEKIGLAMKTVNQTTGQDQDPNNIELSQDEKKRRQFGDRSQRQKIILEAVLDTTCKKCGGKGHLAQDCFKTGEGSYDLIPDLDDYMQSVGTEQTKSTETKKSKEKKKHKEKKKKKEKKKRKKERKHSSTDSDDSSSNRRQEKKKLKKKYRSSSESSDSDNHTRKHKSKKKSHHKKSRSSSTDSR
ncbi:zinc finger CCHC domain-containing protein 17-like [Ruditapes philippinarum]|uniref:zinc finger CCHC domain-containing protein 17-like n=1 Tax=Ruditapes philippinarum TaxID=129788 RepID=UPI00295A9D91|nr:zinc finger CCHC domain-containing protein 17-like [Ruditapes philippinarum]